jgi:hypothetical protein
MERGDVEGLSIAASLDDAVNIPRQAVVRGPSFTGFGKRPLLTPAHHAEREIGIGPFGARICFRRTKPVSGCSCALDMGVSVLTTPEMVSGSRHKILHVLFC